MNTSLVFSRSEGNVKLSEHFKVSEFFCKDGSPVVLVDHHLVQLLESIRTYYKRPVVIRSGYRTPSYNAQIGGARYSQHMFGTAADLSVVGVSPDAVAAYAETLIPDSGGIGIYSTFTHVDVREKKSRWKEK